MSDIPIDPELLKSNPALNYITQLNNATNTDGGDSDDEDLLNHLGASPDTEPTASTHTREHFGCLVKSHMNLSDQAEAALNVFCANPSPDECLILLYAKVLQLEDMGRDAKKAEVAQGLSDELKKNIRSFTHAFVVSPNVTAYCGNCAENVLKAMREMKVRELPSEKDPARTSIVIRSISSSLTSYRNAMKQKIDESMAVDSPTRNIAELAQAILKKTNVPPTLQLFMRLAVLRWHFLQYPESVHDDDFWLQVDETLDVWRTTCKDKATLTNAFNNVYTEDKAKFGNPANTSGY